ncbi:hypothetical protein ABID62_000970 [Bradyrhizobium sp. S3.9.1]
MRTGRDSAITEQSYPQFSVTFGPAISFAT